MLLQRGSLACLYVISLLALLDANAAARSTSFLPFASTVWGSTSTVPSLAPTSNPSNSKRRRQSKRRRKVSNLTQKSRIQGDGGDNNKRKKRKRKRKTSFVAGEDLSGSMSSRERVGRTGRSKVRADRPRKTSFAAEEDLSESMFSRERVGRMGRSKVRADRPRKTSFVAEEDLSEPMFSRERVGRTGRSKARADRPLRRINSTANGKKTKRRRSSRAIGAKQSTETRVSKTKKRQRRISSARTGSIAAPPEKWKDDSKLQVPKRKRSKRRKRVAVNKQPSPKSGPAKGAIKTKRKVKRRKKRRLVSAREPEVPEAHPSYVDCVTGSEDIEKSSLSVQQSLTHDEIDARDNSNDEPDVATNTEEILVERDENLAPTLHQDDEEESVGEQLSVDIEQESVPCASTNDDKHDVFATGTATESETDASVSAPNDDLVASDPVEITNAKVSNVTVDVNTVCDGKDSPAEDISSIEGQELDEMMDSSANVENEVISKDETERGQVDEDEADEASILDEISVQPQDASTETQTEPQIQTQSPLEVTPPDEPVGEDREVDREPDVDERSVEDEDVDSGNIEDSIAKEEDGVVNFIEDILQEDVKSWVDESSSDAGTKPTSILKDTRGGHQPSNPATNDEMKDEINQSEMKDVSGQTVGKEDGTETLAADTTTEALSLDSSLLESFEDCKTDIAVSIVTWNLAEISPAEEDAAFIRKFRKSGIKKGSGSDLVLISGQECENIKPRRSEGSRSREYRRLMIKMLGKQYVPIALHLLGGIQFGLFAKRSFLKEIEEISIADVTCGIGNVFHNKGAIAAFLKVKARNPTSKINKAKSLRMVFVTAHMAAHVKNVEARNSDFWRISSELEAQAPDGFLQEHGVSSEDSENESFLFNSADRVFFCGDLNYRVDLPREFTEFDILEKRCDDATKNLYAELMYHDQLKAAMCENRAFTGFAEGKIEFAPTFKFDKETGSYDTSHKQRIPAWTDRILFKPFGTRVLEYTSVPEAQHSDHRPVHGTFRVSMEGRDLPPKRSRTRKRREPSRRNKEMQ